MFNLINLLFVILFSLTYHVENGLAVASSDDQCEKCQVDIRSYQTDLRLARNEHINSLRKCCGQFATSDGLCDSYIESIIKPIYDHMEDELAPKTICSDFGVCSSSTIANLTSKKLTSVDKVEPDCLLCKQVFRLVNKVIEKQAKINIELALDRVCDIILPESRRKGCHKYVDTYTTKLINFIRRHTDPDVACALMGLCKEDLDTNGLKRLSPAQSSSLLITKSRLVSSPSSSGECVNCFKSVAWAAVTIEDYATSLNAMLTNLCRRYTHNNDDLCKTYMADHFDPITNQLTSKTSVHYFCTNIFGLCPATK